MKNNEKICPRCKGERVKLTSGWSCPNCGFKEKKLDDFKPKTPV